MDTGFQHLPHRYRHEYTPIRVWTNTYAIPASSPKREPLSSKLSTSLRFTKHPIVQTRGFKVTGGVFGKTLAAKVRDLAACSVIKLK